MSSPRFVVVQKGGNPVKSPGTFTLVIDMWDDFHYKTSFRLHYATKDDVVEIGNVKIASRGAEEHGPHTDLGRSFTSLKRKFFSLGQDREYYEELLKLPGDLAAKVLRALRDVAADEGLLQEVENEPVLSASLMRDVPQRTVETQFRRIIRGHEALTPYRFSFTREPSAAGAIPFQIEFGVHPGQLPPTNVHVVIGSNGVGKSKLLRDFVTVATGGGSPALGSFRDEMAGLSRDAARLPFANVVHVAFSAFDPVVNLPTRTRVKAHVVGLSALDVGTLEDQFVSSLRVCVKGPRRKRWISAIRTLAAADALLSKEKVDDLLGSSNGVSENDARELFSRMSSGHKIVVLTVSRLVELVEERSLVLLDEPETHLHPPLLSALTRAISDLVIDRNGVAVVATHSPVVLQEVPSSCVWILRRSGEDLRAWQLDTESFGESVSRLTAEVFHLDVRQTGYHQVLRDLLSRHGWSAASVLSNLEEQLGSEGRFVLRSLANAHGDDSA